MKTSLIASAALFLSLSAFSQTGGPDGTQNTQLGTTVPGVPEQTAPRDLDIGVRDYERGYERDFEQQRMEDTSSLTGGSMGGGREGFKRQRAPVGVGTGIDAGAGLGPGGGF